ncbi:UvrB/UvrC motif-containing protein [Clostridium sp. 19966]|uniref:UvrB/UvrC motif-containing protein n=1 Tax=Clostridium sp. 19966 TaxID=2768166 RepID=UPI0028DE5EEC|nr:UvrB/UvrC motif-containing protein [Clostridium sp. 19966]MDT8715785.1 UvrB/UvrC motif-containing protein [Clostridium sp. 19966]
MFCDRCKKNNATVHVVKIVNGVKEELNLCEDCAREANGYEFGDLTPFANSFSFQNVFSGLIDYMNQSSQNSRQVEMTCPHCGTTYGEFKKKGLMGCDKCYEYFSSTLIPVIKSVQGSLEHVGKMPSKAGENIAGKRKLIKLKEELQKAILLEEYEKAAAIRDQIKEFTKKEGEV